MYLTQLNKYKIAPQYTARIKSTFSNEEEPIFPTIPERKFPTMPKRNFPKFPEKDDENSDLENILTRDSLN